MQRPDLIAGLNLPQDLEVANVLLRQDRFVALPTGALVVVAVGHPVDRRRAAALRTDRDAGDAPAARRGTRAPHRTARKDYCCRVDDLFHVLPRSASALFTTVAQGFSPAGFAALKGLRH